MVKTHEAEFLAHLSFLCCVEMENSGQPLLKWAWCVLGTPPQTKLLRGVQEMHECLTTSTHEHCECVISTTYNRCAESTLQFLFIARIDHIDWDNNKSIRSLSHMWKHRDCRTDFCWLHFLYFLPCRQPFLVVLFLTIKSTKIGVFFLHLISPQSSNPNSNWLFVSKLPVVENRSSPLLAFSCLHLKRSASSAQEMTDSLHLRKCPSSEICHTEPTLNCNALWAQNALFKLYISPFTVLSLQKNDNMEFQVQENLTNSFWFSRFVLSVGDCPILLKSAQWMEVCTMYFQFSALELGIFTIPANATLATYWSAYIQTGTEMLAANTTKAANFNKQ